MRLGDWLSDSRNVMGSVATRLTWAGPRGLLEGCAHLMLTFAHVGVLEEVG